VVPSLVLHEVRAINGAASWDGVSRKMRVVNVPHRIQGYMRGAAWIWRTSVPRTM
jgi:hypothetical protein